MPPRVASPAHTTASPASGGGEAGHENALPQPNPQPDTSGTPSSPYKFLQSEFVIKESTGGQVGKRSEKKPGVKEGEIAFSEELATQYKNFLHDHLQNLLKITNPQVLDNDTHRSELQMREALTTDGKPDVEKIEAYLKSPDGWMITTQLIEQQTSLKLFATGLHAATRPKGERLDQIDENTIRLHLNQGLLNKAIMDRIWPWLDKRINVTGGRPEDRGLAGRDIRGTGLPRDLRRWQSILGQMATSAVLGGSTAIVSLLANHDLATTLIAGSAAASVVPGLMAIRNTLNSGVTIDLRQCVSALRSIQNDANETAYLKAVLNIDANNFVAAGNQINLRPNHALAPNTMREIQTEIFQGLYAREQFYTSLGIPSESLDALPEQHLYMYHAGQAEQTGTRWQQRLEEIFQPQTTGIRDMAGLSPNQAGFDPNNLDIAGNLQRYREARQKVIVEMMEGHAIKVLDKAQSEGRITRIAEKITARGEGGEEKNRRTKVLSERKNALTKDKEKLNQDKTVLDEYAAAKTALETEQRKFETEFEDAFIAGRDIVGERDRVIGLLTNQNDPLSIPARRVVIRNNLNAALIAAYAQADIDLAAQYGANPVPADVRTSIHNGVAQATKELFQAELDALRSEEDELKNHRTRLTQIRDSINTAQKTLGEKADRIVTSAKENLTTMYADYITLGAWGINDAALRTMTVEELMGQINAANAVNALNGWPEAQNNLPANRNWVINAVAEAKAAYDESFDLARNNPNPAVGRLVNYSEIRGWNLNAAGLRITEDQLRNMPRGQLMVLINQANALNAGNGWSAGQNRNPDNIRRLNLAVDEARNRMVLRHNAALTARLADFDNQIDTEQKKIDAINFGSEVDVLNTINDLMTRQGKIFEVAYDVASNRARYTNQVAVDPNDPTFTATEKAVFDGAVPLVGYWEIMDALFDYKKKTDRSVYVSKILKTLPPKALARRINLATGMAPNHADIENITIALNHLQTSIGNGTFTGIDTRRMFRDIINGLGEQADAI